MLALYMLVIGVLFLSVTVRVCWCFVCFGMWLASLGHVTPHMIADLFRRFCKNRAFCFIEFPLVQLGGVSPPRTGAE